MQKSNQIVTIQTPNWPLRILCQFFLFWLAQNQVLSGMPFLRTTLAWDWLYRFSSNVYDLVALLAVVILVNSVYDLHISILRCIVNLPCHGLGKVHCRTANDGLFRLS